MHLFLSLELGNYSLFTKSKFSIKKSFLSIFAFVLLTLATQAQCPWIEQSTGFATASRGINHVCAVDDQVVWATAYDGITATATCQDYTRTNNGDTLWVAGTIPGIANLSLAMISAIDD